MFQWNQMLTNLKSIKNVREYQWEEIYDVKISLKFLLGVWKDSQLK